MHVYMYDKAGNLTIVQKAFPTDFDTRLPTVTEFEAWPTPIEQVYD